MEQSAPQTVLTANDAGTVHLPEGVELSALDISRDGQDLILTSPDGETYVVENYFLLPDAPVILSASGSILSPGLVQSFLTQHGDVRVAAVDAANDQSPVGEVTEIKGEATVTHADGSKEKITSGTKIFEGDIVETDAHGAVNITFADESTFAISENARLAVDDFSFNPGDQSGTTGLSILRGVFMFTSGLIGRENPDAVHLETPVGSIGIRGTIIGGTIQADGKAQISVLEGAIVVRNGTGEQILSGQFETVQLSSFNAPISNIGQLNAGQMTQSYGAVRDVSPTLFTSIDDAGRDQPQTNTQPQQNQPEAQSEQKAAPENKSESQPQSDAKPAQAETQAQPQAEAQQPAQPTQTVVAETPVFQNLNTGSNLSTAPTTPPPAAQKPAPAPVVVNTAPPAPATTPPPAQPPVNDTANHPANTAGANNQAPTAMTLSATTIAENPAAGAVVGILTGTDPDTNARLTYNMLDTAGGRFNVNTQTGELYVNNRALINYEANTSHNITVRVTDQGGLSFDKTFTINITDINEAPPVINISGNSIAENATANTAIGSLSAVDPEGDTLTYSIINNPGGKFAINATTGIITSTASLDYEAAPSYTLRVRAEGSGGVGYEQNIVINVTNVNETPTNATLSANTVSENASTGTVIGTVTGVDPDAGGTLSYSLQSNPGGKFAINSSTGQISVASALDYETSTSHSITVRVTDQGGLTYDKNFTINVTDINEAPTSVSLSTGFSMDERDASGSPAVILSTVTVADSEAVANNQNYNFKVFRYNGSTYVEDTRFEVVDVSGTWKLRAKAGIGFDHETESTMQLRVQLTDGTNNPVNSGSNLTFNINDVNEAATAILMNGHATNSVTPDPVQGKFKGAHLGTLSSVDPDTNPSNQAQAGDYTITNVAGASGGLTVNDFEIVDITDDDNVVHHILKMKSGVEGGFSSGTFTVTVALGGLTQTFTFSGRDDTLSIERLDGKNGFIIDNDNRFPGSGSDGVRFGASIAIGDFDNDGKLDLIFGAPQAQNDTNEISGGVYGFDMGAIGSDTLNGQILLSTMTGSAGSKGFFHELKTGSDDNGKRFANDIVALRKFDATAGADIAVTAPGYNKVVVMHGDGTVISTINNIPTTGTGETLANSINLASVGDINNDGYTDLLIGASGAAAIVYGGASATGTIDFSTLSTKITGAGGYGAAVAGLGDFNRDGFADFVVSAPNTVNTNTSANGAGSVTVYHGANIFSTTANTVNKFTIKGTVAEDHLGSVVSSAGDFNNDGFNDLLIRSSATDGGRGAVHLIFGDPDLKGTEANITDLNTNGDFRGATIHWTNNDSTIKVGGSFTRAGDFNADGYDDIVIDVSKNLGGDNYQHTLYVIYGSNTGTTDYDLNALTTDPLKAYKIVSTQSMGEHITLTGGQDLNGDGFDDIVIGNPYASYDDDNIHDGSAAVIYGGSYDLNAAIIRSSSGGFTATTGKAYVGTAGADDMNAAGGSKNDIAFHGLSGNDTMTISLRGAIREFDGGAGMDSLKLTLRADSDGSFQSDTIDLRGISSQVSNVEIIHLLDSSRADTIQLNIGDIISMASSAENRQLIIAGPDTSNADPGGDNALEIYNGIGGLADLSLLGFTKDANTDTVQDQVTKTIGAESHDFYVYTNQAQGIELLVDTRLVNAHTLAG